MAERRPLKDTHLGTEEVERLALESGPGRPSILERHAQSCARCRSAVADLKGLHAALVALATLRPASGFSDRVMACVRLPIPWRARTAVACRTHWKAAVAGVAGTLALLGGGLALALRHPEFTPGGVATFLLEQALAAVWAGVMSLSRAVYDAWLATGAVGLADKVSVGGALLALATLAVVGLGALRVLIQLLHDTRQPARPGGPRWAR